MLISKVTTENYWGKRSKTFPHLHVPLTGYIYIPFSLLIRKRNRVSKCIQCTCIAIYDYRLSISKRDQTSRERANGISISRTGTQGLRNMLSSMLLWFARGIMPRKTNHHSLVGAYVLYHYLWWFFLLRIIFTVRIRQIHQVENPYNLCSLE